MRLSKVSFALIAAGVGAGLATGYTHLDTLSVGAAHAATQPAAVAPQRTGSTAGANLPDFTALVERAGASVVNISTFHAKGKGAPDHEDIDEDSQFYEFFKRFGGVPNAPGCARSSRRAAVGSGFIVSPDGYIAHQRARGRRRDRSHRQAHRQARIHRQGRRRRQAHRRRADQDRREGPADGATSAIRRVQRRRMGARDRLAVRFREQRDRRHRQRQVRARCRTDSMCRSSRPTWPSIPATRAARCST